MCGFIPSGNIKMCVSSISKLTQLLKCDLVALIQNGQFYEPCIYTMLLHYCIYQSMDTLLSCASDSFPGVNINYAYGQVLEHKIMA